MHLEHLAELKVVILKILVLVDLATSVVTG